MESRSIFVLLGLLAATAVMAEAYRWVADDGVVHYSDRPHEGAEAFELATYSGSPPAPRNTTTRPAQDISQLRFIVNQPLERFTLRAACTDAEYVLCCTVQADDQQILIEQNDSRTQAVEDIA